MKAKASVYLNLYQEFFEKDNLEKAKKIAKKIAKRDGIDIDGHVWEDLELSGGEFFYEDGTIVISGGLFCKEKEIGFIDLTIPLNLDIVLDIIQDHIKKLNKLKNVLESVK